MYFVSGFVGFETFCEDVEAKVAMVFSIFKALTVCSLGNLRGFHRRESLLPSPFTYLLKPIGAHHLHQAGTLKKQLAGPSWWIKAFPHLSSNILVVWDSLFQKGLGKKKQ